MLNEKTNINIKKEILDAIEIMVNNAIRNLPYDITRQARVMSVNGDTITIMLDGSKYEIKSRI